MMKKALKGVLLAACCAIAQSGIAAEWEVKWQGFVLDNPGGSYFSPNQTHGARFSGVDVDHDDVISLNELSSLIVDGSNLLSCPGEGNSCSVSSFSYSAAGGVQFEGYRSDSYIDEWSNSVDTDSYTYVAKESFSWNHYGQGSTDEWWVDYFNAQTVETVTLISSVPEPSTYAMLGAGLLLLGAAAKRRKQR
jgi:hypothetical protein